MAIDIVEIIKFKQEVNDTIDNCINIIRTGKPDDDNQLRLLTQVTTYYDRMKILYANQHGESDDDDKFISDESDNEDYSKIMENRVFANPNNVRDDNLDKDEMKIRNQVLGLNFNISYQELNNLNDMNDMSQIFNGDDTSVDPNIYDANENNVENNEENNEESDEDDQNNDPIINNTKKTLKLFVPEPDVEIINGDTMVDYDEPSIN